MNETIHSLTRLGKSRLSIWRYGLTNTDQKLCPMKLSGPNSRSFTLTIVGYEFPALATTPYDSNWLDIRVDVISDQGTWSASDPCLLTYEVQQLADWLDAIGEHRNASSVCSFTEPCLAFQLLTDDQGQPILRILFELELRPAWAASKTASREDVWIELPLTLPSASRAAQELRTELERYPQRTAV